MKFVGNSAIFTVACALIATSLPADAATTINNPDVHAFWIMGASGEVVADSQVPGGAAQRMVVKNPAGIWEHSAHSGVDGKISKGDEVTVSAWLRVENSAAGANGHVNIKLEENAAPYTAVGELEVTPGAEWKEYSFKATARKAFGAGDVSVTVQYGDIKQTVLVGPVTVVDNGPAGSSN